MAKPQIENGYVVIATELMHQLAKVNLSPYEWRLLMAVLIKTYGWRKKMDYISLSQLSAITELPTSHICRAKTSLLSKGLLHRENGLIGPNKNYETWFITNTGNKSAITGQKQRKVTNTGNAITGNAITNTGNAITNTGNLPPHFQAKNEEKLPAEALQKNTTLTNTKRRKPSASNTTEKELSPKAIQEYWNSKDNLPRIRSMTDSRKNKLKTRLMEDDFAENWKMIIDKIAASSFCTGGNNRRWKADIDWLLANSTNYIKVLEGKYDNSKAGEASACAPLDPVAAAQRQRFLTGKA